LTAGVLVFAFGVFDLFDGALARATGRASRFGAFLDSTLDRTGESLVLAGVAVGAAFGDFPSATLFAGLALTFASGVTYTRAKAESLGVHGEVGFAPREVRLVLLAATLVLAGVLDPPRVGISMVPMDGTAGTILVLGLGLIASLSAVTIVQRILHIRRQLEPGDVPTSNREHE
jgi:CDP-diacylglycerol--glycerol-3-phosphate 3-phosphatidyltransferase